MATKLFTKLGQAAMVAFAGYEVGENHGLRAHEYRNQVMPIPQTENKKVEDEHYSMTEIIVACVLCFFLIFILLIIRELFLKRRIETNEPVVHFRRNNHVHIPANIAEERV